MRPNSKRKNTDIHCVIEKYLKENMKNLMGFVSIVKEADSTRIPFAKGFSEDLITASFSLNLAER